MAERQAVAMFARVAHIAELGVGWERRCSRYFPNFSMASLVQIGPVRSSNNGGGNRGSSRS